MRVKVFLSNVVGRCQQKQSTAKWSVVQQFHRIQRDSIIPWISSGGCGFENEEIAENVMELVIDDCGVVCRRLWEVFLELDSDL